MLSIGLHEGVISSEVWLDVQRKLDGNTQLKKGRSGTYSWLTGLLKCGRCGYAMRVMSGTYFYCSGKANHHVCDGVSGKPEIEAAEQAVYSELKQKFEEIRELHPMSKTQTSPKANKLKMKLETLNSQIENLVCKITETTAAIGKVLEEKLGQLISERDSIKAELDKLGEPKQRRSYEAVIPLLDKFPEMPVEVKRQIAEQFIAKVLMWEDRLEIQWRF